MTPHSHEQHDANIFMRNRTSSMAAFNLPCAGSPENCFGDFRGLGGTYIISAQLYRCVILHIAFVFFFATSSHTSERPQPPCLCPLQCAMHKPQARNHLKILLSIRSLRSDLGVLPGIIQAPLCLAALRAGALNMGIQRCDVPLGK